MISPMAIEPISKRRPVPRPPRPIPEPGLRPEIIPVQ